MTPHTKSQRLWDALKISRQEKETIKKTASDICLEIKMKVNIQSPDSLLHTAHLSPPVLARTAAYNRPLSTQNTQNTTL